MRLIYFLPDVDAGVSRIVKNLLNYRPVNSDIFYEVVLFSCKEDKTIIVAGTDFKADKIHRFIYSKYENIWNVFKRMASYIKSENDIIVSNDGFEVKMAVALKLLNPIAYILHGDFSYYYSIIKPYQFDIDCFIVYSNKMQVELNKILDKTINDKLWKIYYPLAFLSQKKINIKIDSKILKIVFAGYLIERKGVDLLPAIYDLLIEKGMKNFELEIIGDGELFKMLNNKFVGVNNVRLSGWQTNSYVIKRMQEADIFLFPSRLEGLPNVVLEALEAGAVPICNKNTSGINDVLWDGKNGLLTKTDDPLEFANAIFKLYDEQSLLNNLKQNSYLSLNQFEPNTQARLYEETILSCKRKYSNNKMGFSKYKRGRILDRAWLPNKFVILLRKFLKDSRF